jgi:hypothetical protein
LQRCAAEHVIALPPPRAKYVKVVFLSNHGGSRTQAAEVKIIEGTDGTSSIVSDIPKNLALPALGGAIVWFTSQDGHGPASELVDGQVTTKGVGVGRRCLWSRIVPAAGYRLRFSWGSGRADRSPRLEPDERPRV